MQRLPYIHAKDEAQRVSFASPLSRGLCFFRFLRPPAMPLLVLVLVLPLVPLALALWLRREEEGDARDVA